MSFFRKLLLLSLMFFFTFVYADTEVTAYQLWLETTEKPEKVKVGLLVKDDVGMKPGCEGCEDCTGYGGDDDDHCQECMDIGCYPAHGYYDRNVVAGEVYRGKFDNSDKLSEVVKINFDDYFDECVAPGKYEYILYDEFPFKHCLEEVSHYDGHRPDCRNNASITIPEHSENCPEHEKVSMTQEEFSSMIFSHDKDVTSDDDEFNDYENCEGESETEIHDEKTETPDEFSDDAVETDDNSQETTDPDQVPDSSNVDNEVYDDNYHFEDCGMSTGACSAILI